MGSRDAKAYASAAQTSSSTTESSKPEGTGTRIKDDVQGAMLQPSIVNNQWVRGGVVLAGIGAVAASTPHMPTQLATFLHLTCYAGLLGTNLWNSFFVGITMFKIVPRQVFGRIQSKLFPLYFQLSTVLNALMLVSLAGVGNASLSSTQALAGLGVGLVGNLLNLLFLEPVSTKLMFERYDIENKDEKTEADKAQIAVLYKKFGMYHGMSALANLAVFAAIVAHGWILAGAIGA